MQRFTEFTAAETAAQIFFTENFGHTSGVGSEGKGGQKVEFYSKDDPGMDDTFTCLVGERRVLICFHSGSPMRTYYWNGQAFFETTDIAEDDFFNESDVEQELTKARAYAMKEGWIISAESIYAQWDFEE